jgi:hypothetical protein
MKRTTRSLALLLILVLLASIASAGCATVKNALGQKPVGQGLIVSGESLVFTSKQFENAGNEFTARCKAGAPNRLSADTCNAFDTFGQKFKAVWPNITAAWRAAVKFRDATLQSDTQKILNDLAAQLFAFLGQLGLTRSQAIEVVHSLFDEQDAALRDRVVSDLERQPWRIAHEGGK